MLFDKALLESIQKVMIYMVVVDECHCVLEWGDTFRPDYQRIGEFIESLPERPMVAALTATAAPSDRKKIKKSLGIPKAEEHVSSIDRPNLVLLKENCATFQEKLRRTKHFIRKYHTKDAKEANQHSYRLQSRRASFTAYDKRYVLQQLERCPDDLTDKGILRIEAELQRESLLKRIKAKKGWSNEKILKESAKRSARILSKYLCQLLGSGEHMRYQDAVALIESAKMKKKMRERMLYLLRKTSDSNNLDRALAKLRKKYDLKESQVNRVLKKFQKLGISPITLQNRSENNALPSILSALN